MEENDAQQEVKPKVVDDKETDKKVSLNMLLENRRKALEGVNQRIGNSVDALSQGRGNSDLFDSRIGERDVLERQVFYLEGVRVQSAIDRAKVIIPDVDFTQMQDKQKTPLLKNAGDMPLVDLQEKMQKDMEEWETEYEKSYGERALNRVEIHEAADLASAIDAVNSLYTFSVNFH